MMKEKMKTVKGSQLKKFDGDDSYSIFNVDDFVKFNDTIYKVIGVNNSFHVKLQNIENSRYFR